MTSEDWRKIIITSCIQAGTYKPCFDNIINTLSEILAQKDEATQQFEKSGGNMLIAYTNKAGKTNPVINPLFKIMKDLDKEALTYWKELGLTPLRLKRIHNTGLHQGRNVSLSEILAQMESECAEGLKS